MKRTAVFVLTAGLVFAGCSASAPSSTPIVATPTPQIIYVTPEPTVAPTPKPTAEPTEEPTAEPTSDLSSGYYGVMSHMVDTTSRSADILDEVTSASGDSDLASTKKALEKLVRWSVDELTWINSADIPACASPMIEHWRLAVTNYGAFAVAATAALEELDFDTMEAAQSLMQDGNTEIALMDYTLCS